MIARLIYSKMWQDNFFTSLSPAEKTLFMYFLTCSAVNIIHLYEAPERVVLFETGISAVDLENAKNKMQAQGKLHFYKDYVYIANAYRYQNFEGKKNDEAKRRLYSQLPKDVMEWYQGISDTTPILPRYPLYPYSYKGDLVKEDEIDLDEVEEGINSAKN